jgi:hypothetical protein
MLNSFTHPIPYICNYYGENMNIFCNVGYDVIIYHQKLKRRLLERETKEDSMG